MAGVSGVVKTGLGGRERKGGREGGTDLARVAFHFELESPECQSV